MALLFLVGMKMMIVCRRKYCLRIASGNIETKTFPIPHSFVTATIDTMEAILLLKRIDTKRKACDQNERGSSVQNNIYLMCRFLLILINYLYVFTGCPFFKLKTAISNDGSILGCLY